MIVRDEADCMAACLDSLASLNAEVCILDTGSSDGTQRLAAARAQRFREIPWPGDFAAARNASIALCTRPWVFVIDADERLSAEGCRELRELSAGPADRAWRFETRTFTRDPRQSGFVAANGPEARGYPGWVGSAKARLFPNRPELRFTGAVHELVEPSLAAAGIPVSAARRPVLHYPFEKSDDRIRSKREAYAELGRRKIDADPADPQAYFEYGNQAAELERYAGAIAAFRQGLALDPGRADMWKDLGAVLHLTGRHGEAERALTIALRIDPDLADAWRNRGVVRAALERYDEAAADIEEAMALNPAWTDGAAYLAEIRRRGAP